MKEIALPLNSGSRHASAWSIPFLAWTCVCTLTVGNFNSEIVPSPVSGNSLNQLLVTLFFFAWGFYGIAKRSGVALGEKPAVAVLALCSLSIASAAWSDVPSQSLLKGATFIAGLFAVLALVWRLNGTEILLGIFYGSTATLALSVLAAALYPDIAQHDVVLANADAWRGIFPQKNVLGRAAMIVFCSGFTLIAFKETRRFAFLVPMLGAGYLLVKSQSSTSIVGCAAFIMAYPALLIFMRARGYKAAVLACLLLIALLSLLASFGTIIEMVASIFGKDLTFTGRSFLWTTLVEDYLKQPLLGYGTGAYFSDQRIGLFDLRLGWDADNAHNGFFELALELGAAGIGLFLLIFWLVTSRVRLISREKPEILQLFLFLTPVLALQNLMESTLMRPTNIMWLAFVALTLRTSIDMRELRNRG